MLPAKTLLGVVGVTSCDLRYLRGKYVLAHRTCLV